MSQVPTGRHHPGEIMIRAQFGMKGLLSNRTRRPTLEAFAPRRASFHSGPIWCNTPRPHADFRTRQGHQLFARETLFHRVRRAVLMGHPDVNLAAVVAQRMDTNGARRCPAARFMSLNPCNERRKSSMIAFARQTLAGFKKRPNGVIFSRSCPKNLDRQGTK